MNPVAEYLLLMAIGGGVALYISSAFRETRRRKTLPKQWPSLNLPRGL